MWQNIIKQRILYECPNTPLQLLLDKEFMKEIFLVNILMMKKHQVKLKQNWVAEIGLIVN